MNETIVASDLTKSYKEVRALAELSLTVPEGSVLGLLGPNGAGKTTAVRILTTLLRPDSGSAVVAGVDVLADPAEARRKIGVSGQNAAVDENLTGFENLDMVGRLYHLGAKASRQRARELLDQFDLADAGDRPAKTYSGGMRRRLDLAGALVARPPVLFLDEPTTGLDPRSRTDLWGVIGELVQGGTTLLLTTQYLEEAERLADNILVIDRGTAIAEGTADELKAKVGGERLELHRVHRSRRRDDHVDDPRRRVRPPRHRRPADLPARCHRGEGADGGGAAARRVEIELHDVALRRPTLDDVFLALTGHGAEEAEATNEEVQR